jgi:membrane protease YdiL (CAAX protease family)
VARSDLDAILERRPLLWSVALTILWLGVVQLLGAMLVGGRQAGEAELPGAVVNAAALGVPLTLVALLGWWSRAGFDWPVLGRHWFVLAPLALVALAWLSLGVKSEPVDVLLAGALLQLTLGLNEEAMFRGLVQGVWAVRTPEVQCGAVALIFGLQHGANLLQGHSGRVSDP